MAAQRRIVSARFGARAQEWARALFFLFALAPPGATADAGNEPSHAEVDRAVSRAVEHIKSRQSRDGAWKSADSRSPASDELTALAAYALSRSGAAAGSVELRQANERLQNRSQVYSVFARAFALMLACRSDAQARDAVIRDDVRFLRLDQSTTGGWSEGKLLAAEGAAPVDSWLHSIIALLALADAHDIGHDANALVWRRAESFWIERLDVADEAHGVPGAADAAPAPHDACSAEGAQLAGLLGLYLTHDRLHLDEGLTFNGRYKAKCGTLCDSTRKSREARERAWVRCHDRFRVDSTDPITASPAAAGRGVADPVTLYLAARLGLQSGEKRFGERAWAREISERLLCTQAEDGSWGNLRDTCFSLLALVEASTPILVNKLSHGDGDEWNRDPRDVANVLRWAARNDGARTGWQVVALDDSQDVFDAPALMFNGHDAPVLSPAQRRKLVDYVHGGGVVIATACCSRAAFATDTAVLFQSLFPRSMMGTLDERHPAWRAVASVEPRGDVVGFSDGCRTNLFVLNQGACCAWQQMRHADQRRLFDLGHNLLAHSTYDRAVPRSSAERERAFVGPAVGEITVARMRHGGDWWVEPAALRFLSMDLANRGSLAVTEAPAVDGSAARSAGVDVIWLTGHSFVPPDALAGDELRAFVAEGGMLAATACCGHSEFDEAFRAWVGDAFGSDGWRSIPADDPLKTGAFAPSQASPMSGMNFRRRIGDHDTARLDSPVLYGIARDERWAVVYSPYDIHCGLVGHTCPDCAGYVPKDATAVAANILLYAASQREKCLGCGARE